MEVERDREDRFSITGRFPREGVLYVSEPGGPGWRSSLEAAESGPAPARAEPALRAFQRLDVPAGVWTARFRYDPASFRLGRALSLLLLGALAAYWYNRFRRTVSDEG